MLTTEFKMEDAIAVWIEEGREEGREEGEAKGREEGISIGGQRVMELMAKLLREGLSLDDALKKAEEMLKQ